MVEPVECDGSCSGGQGIFVEHDQSVGVLVRDVAGVCTQGHRALALYSSAGIVVAASRLKRAPIVLDPDSGVHGTIRRAESIDRQQG